jgi:hypothetical protein
MGAPGLAFETWDPPGKGPFNPARKGPTQPDQAVLFPQRYTFLRPAALKS